jgi:transcription elongation factor SPT6
MKHRQTYVKRVIVHPSFRNISFAEAEVLMNTMDQGDAIVRPSSKVSISLNLKYQLVYVS